MRNRRGLVAAGAVALGLVVVAIDRYGSGPHCKSTGCTFYDDRGVMSEGRCGISPDGAECLCYKAAPGTSDVDRSTPGQRQPGCQE